MTRQSLPDTYPGLINGLDLHVHTVRQQINVPDRRLDIIRSTIKNETQMVKLIQTFNDGWPQSSRQCNPEIAEYFNHRDQLTI